MRPSAASARSARFLRAKLRVVSVIWMSKCFLTFQWWRPLRQPNRSGLRRSGCLDQTRSAIWASAASVAVKSSSRFRERSAATRGFAADDQPLRPGSRRW